MLASAFMIAEVYVDLYQPRMMALIVDEGILGLASGGVSNLGLVISTGSRMLLVVIAGGLCGLLSALFANITGQGCGNEIRKLCFDRIMHFSFEQTDDFTTGSLITRITNDVTQLQQLIMQLIRGLVRCLMFFIGGTAALLSLDLSFGVIVACAFPLILIDIIFVVWRTNPLFTVLQESLDRLNSIIQENVTGIRVVKAFIQEKQEEAAKTVTIYYYTEEDKMYLRYRSKMLGMSTSEFLMKLIEEDKAVDVNDPLHEEFRREIGRLSTSVKMTEKERLRFTNAAIQNRLPETHYVGYLLKKNRMNDPEW